MKNENNGFLRHVAFPVNLNLNKNINNENYKKKMENYEKMVKF